MEKIRVLVYHPALTPYRIDLFNALAGHFHLRTLFFRANPVSQSFDQAQLRQQLQCDYGDLSRGVDILGRQFRWGVGSAIRTFEPQVVVAMEYAPSTFMAAWAKMRHHHKKPFGLVLWTADNVEMCANASRLRALARKILLGAADGLVVYTEATKNWYANYGFDPGQIAVCANINRPENFRSRLAEALPLAYHLFHRHGLSGKMVFLSVGRLAAVKGVDRVLRAFQTVRKHRPESRLAIIGDGSERKNLESLAKSLELGGAVLFVGQLHSQELMAWYLLGQVFILASTFEPYGAVVHEALTSGIPVVCTKIAGARDLIVEGKNGWVFDPGNNDELTRCMLASLDSRPQRAVPPDKLPISLMPIAFDNGVSDFVRIVRQAGNKVN